MRDLILCSLLFACFICEAQQPFNAVRTSLHTDDFERTKKVLDSCSFANYHQDSVLFYKGLLMLKQGNKKNARTICHSLQKAYPSFSEVHYLSAMIYFVEENYGSSIDEFGKLIKNNPKHVKALYNRSLAYGMLEDYPSAIDDLSTCISMYPEHAFTYYSRAYWYEFTGKQEEAKKDYELSIKLDPKNFDAYFGLAFIYQQQKENAKACETITAAISAGSQIAEELKENFCRQ